MFEEQKPSQKSDNVPTPEQISLFKDDDVVEEKAAAVPVAQSSTAPTEAPDIIQAGMSFFNQLVKTFSDKKATDSLVKSLTEKDSATGRTYVKIPVESEEMVHSAINLLSGFFKAIGK